MKKWMLMLLLPCWAVQAQVLFQSGFEGDKPEKGDPPKRMAPNDTKAEVVAAAELEAAAGASPLSMKALLLQGGEAEKHAWQPAVDVGFPDQMDGMILIQLRVRNLSFEPAQFGLQLANKGEETYQVWHTLTLYPDRIQVSGTGRGLARDQVSTGKDAEWVTLRWTMPLPESPTIVEPPVLLVNGKDQGEIRNEPKTPGAPSVNNLRLWLPSLRGVDSRFLVDDVLILYAPTKERMDGLVRAMNL